MTRANRTFVRRCAAAVGGLALSIGAGPAMAQDAPAAKPQPQTAQSQVILPPKDGCCPQDGWRPHVQGCNDCGSGGCGNGGGIQAGAAFYYIKPVWTTNPAFATTPIDSLTPINQTDFDYNYTFTPALWLGYTSNSGLGGRVRWFRFDQNDSIGTVNDGTQGIITAAPLGLPAFSFEAGDQVTVGSTLRIETWDLELTQSCGSCNWTALVTGGVRYAHVRQNYSASVVGVEGPTDVDQLWSGHSFNGIGPTASIEGRRKLGNSLAVYASGRGSLLWGDGGQSASLSGNPFASEPLQASTERDTFVSVAELEVGGEFSRGNLFVRAGLVAHGWFGLGNSSNSSDIGLFLGSRENNIDLGLFGLAVSAGINY